MYNNFSILFFNILYLIDEINSISLHVKNIMESRTLKNPLFITCRFVLINRGREVRGAEPRARKSRARRGARINDSGGWSEERKGRRGIREVWEDYEAVVPRIRRERRSGYTRNVNLASSLRDKFDRDNSIIPYYCKISTLKILLSRDPRRNGRINGPESIKRFDPEYARSTTNLEQFLFLHLGRCANASSRSAGIPTRIRLARVVRSSRRAANSTRRRCATKRVWNAPRSLFV